MTGRKLGRRNMNGSATSPAMPSVSSTPHSSAMLCLSRIEPRTPNATSSRLRRVKRQTVRPMP